MKHSDLHAREEKEQSNGYIPSVRDDKGGECHCQEQKPLNECDDVKDKDFEIVSEEIDPNKRRWCLVFFILDLLLASTILLMRFRQEDQCSKGLKRPPFCIPCQDVYITEGDREENIFDFKVEKENQQDVCCARDENEIDRLIEKFLNKNYRRDQALEKLRIYPDEAVQSETTPAAHLIGIDNDRSGENANVTLWKFPNNKSVPGRNISYNNGCLQIENPGLYYIYSQVTFLNIKGRPGDQVYFKHTMHRTAVNCKDELLLETVSSECETSDNNETIPSYLGAVFHICQGDKICVKATNTMSLSAIDNSNYFGLYMI